MKSVAFVFLLVVSGVANAAPMIDAEAAAIRAAITARDNAYDAGDLEKYMQVFASDFLSFSLGAPSGGQDKKTTAENLRKVFLINSGHSSSDVQEITVSGKMAYVRTNFKLTLTPKSGGETQQYSGYDIEVWDKGDDGQWRVTRYMGIPNQVNCPR